MSDRVEEGPGAGVMMRLFGDARRALAVAFKREGTLSVDEAVEILGQSKTAVRAHLLKMEELGVLERVSTEASGARGRPALRFRWTERGDALFPGSDDALLTGLLEHLIELGHEGLIRAYFEREWGKRRLEYERVLSLSDGDVARLDVRLDALNEVLEDGHFLPAIERHEDGVLVIRECHCPFPAAVKATRAPCELEARFLADVVGRPHDRAGYVFEGRRTCTFEFDLS